MSEPQESTGKTLSAEVLCSLTGLTDRRHRQIAKEGFFPPPVKGQYQLTPTLQGMFKYYRELGERQRHKRDEIDDEKLRKLKLANDETAGRLADKETLFSQVAASIPAIRDLAYAKLEHEAPNAMSTLDVPSARIIGRRLASELIQKWQEIFKAWSV